MLTTMNKVTTTASRLFLFAVFLYAGLDKAFHYTGFIRALQSYVILPEALAPYLAFSLILAELSVAVGLLVPLWRRHAAQAAAGLLLLFTVALAVNHWLNPEAICGCWFTITLSQSTGHHILQNLLMASLAASLGFSKTVDHSHPDVYSTPLKQEAGA